MNGRNQGVDFAVQQVIVAGIAEQIFHPGRCDLLFVGNDGAATRRDLPILCAVNNQRRDILLGEGDRGLPFQEPFSEKDYLIQP